MNWILELTLDKLYKTQVVIGKEYKVGIYNCMTNKLLDILTEFSIDYQNIMHARYVSDNRWVEVYVTILDLEAWERFCVLYRMTKSNV